VVSHLKKITEVCITCTCHLSCRKKSQNMVIYVIIFKNSENQNLKKCIIKGNNDGEYALWTTLCMGNKLLFITGIVISNKYRNK